MYFVALHARDVEARGIAGGVEHRIVAAAPGAEAEIVADEHVACAEAAQQHAVDEGLWRQGGQRLVEAQHDGLLDAAALELGELVTQRRDACRRLERAAGAAGLRGEEVARMRLESQGAGRHAAVPRFADQQRQHGLVAPVHAVEVADRDGAGRSDAGVVVAAKHLHSGDYCGTAGPCGAACALSDASAASGWWPRRRRPRSTTRG